MPAPGNNFKVAYEFTNGQRFTASTTVAALTLEAAAKLAASPEGQALYQPPLPENFTNFALVSVVRIEPEPKTVVIDDVTTTP